jgi:Protein of unknown function (DUF4239)
MIQISEGIEKTYMTFYWIYDLANWQLGVLIIAVCVSSSLAGLFLTRPLVKQLLDGSDRYNDVVSWVFAGIGVFYGLALGLIAVGTWENFSGIDSQISKEAASLGALYNDLDGYPQPLRSELENELRDYTKFIVERDWPAHRKGEENEEGTRLLHKFEDEVMEFTPNGERQKIIHAEVIKSLDEVVEARRLRISSVPTGLPAALWAVVLIGAILNTSLMFLFWIENLKLHAILVSIFATFLALLLFLTAVMDNPFRGEFSVSPDNFQELLDKVMTPSSSTSK